MKEWTCALLFSAIFLLGCTGLSEETKVKCPKCGTIFTIDSRSPGAPPARY